MTEPVASCQSAVRSEAPTERGGQRAGGVTPHVLDPEALPDHIDALYRAAWAMCGSRYDAEDLVQTTFAHVLKRRRVIRSGNERGYLLRALRNTYSSRYRTLAAGPKMVPLSEEHTHPGADPASVSARQIMEAVVAAPPLFRDAVIAVDILGLSYLEAARSLGTREATITTRLYRGRQHIARELSDGGV